MWLLHTTLRQISILDHVIIYYDHDQKKRNRKGSNILTLVRTFLNESENWEELKEKQCYQFPGIFSSPTTQHLYYTPDMKSLHQSSETDSYIQIFYGWISSCQKVN